jgi:EAL and modified HD-GYP domain-containing signal transduction protein
LIVMSAARGRCCELLDARMGSGGPGDGFLIGMCSLLDAILSMPMEQIVENLSLADDTRGALLGHDGPGRRRLDCVIAYERGDWAGVLRQALAAGIDPQRLPQVHEEAWHWAHQLQALRAAS